MKTTVLAVIVTALTTSLCLSQPGVPEANGLTPVTGTIYVNTNHINNGQVEAESVAIAANGNVMFSWEDDGSGITDYGGVWSIYNSSGTLITPATEQTNMSLQRVASYQKITNTFLSNFRADGSAVWGQPCGWSTHAKANLFGNGLSLGKITWTIGWEVPEFYNINMNDSGLAAGGLDANIDDCNDSPAWQLLNNDGTAFQAGPINGITNIGILMFSDAEVQPVGDIRVGGFEYLSNGNIVLVGDSRKPYDRTNRFGTLNGGSGEIPVYKIVKPSGEEVRPYSLVNAGTNNRASMTKTTGVTANGFAVRYRDRVLNRGIVRMFDNNGTTTTGDINIFALTGYPQAGADGDAGGIGFSGNGKDAYLLVARGNPGNTTNGPWLTVLNANGTLRWSRPAADINDPINNTVNSEVSGAIAADGRVIAVWSSVMTNYYGTNVNTIQARLFNSLGTPMGKRFVVSEWESPTNQSFIYPSQSPQVAWRGNEVAICWRSKSPPDNPLGVNPVLGARIFTVQPGVPEANGLTPVTGTIYVNTNHINNGQVEAESVAIAANGNVMFSWEDDGSGITDYGGVWSIYNSSGTLITPPTEQTNMSLQRVASYQKITNTFLSNFRADGSAVWGQPCGWSTHAKANLFGNGLSLGKITWTIGWEVPEFYNINMNDSGLAAGGLDANIDDCNDSPAWQLLNNDGTAFQAGPINGITNIGILMFSDAEVQPVGDIRVGGFEYLSNGNIVLVGDSRKPYDRTNRFGTLNGGSGEIPVYKIVKPSGEEVRPYSLVNAGTNNRASMTKTTGVTANGFAVRYRDRVLNRGIVRMFDNNGTTTTGDINIFALTGYPQAGADGDAGGIGFSGNGKDAYLLVARGNPGNTTNGPWLTVLNANGTLRWSRPAADINDPINNTVNSEVSGAIAADGRVIAVWSSVMTNYYGTNVNTIQARLFSPWGTPLGDRFVVSEWETPINQSFVYPAQSPQAAWRGNLVAICWRSKNPPENPLGVNPVLGSRIFTVTASAPPTGLAVSKSGGNVTISWSGGGTLESADGVAGPWTSIYSPSPYAVAAGSAQKLFRVKGW